MSKRDSLGLEAGSTRSAFAPVAVVLLSRFPPAQHVFKSERSAFEHLWISAQRIDDRLGFEARFYVRAFSTLKKPLPLTRLADEKDRTGVISKDGEVSVVLDVL
jgi:hypothetical protein